MTPFGIRRMVRRELGRAAAAGLRALANQLRPEDEEVVLDAGGASDLGAASTVSSPGADAGTVPEPPSASPSEPAEPPSAAYPTPSAPLSGGYDPSMDLMAGLSGDMGPAIAARVQEQAEADAEVGGERYDQILDALHTIFDPEIPVDIYELGLIYRVDVREDDTVGVQMTLTSPNCPAAQDLPAEVHEKVMAVPGVIRADVDVVFEPPWTPDLMSDEAKLELNML